MQPTIRHLPLRTDGRRFADHVSGIEELRRNMRRQRRQAAIDWVLNRLLFLTGAAILTVGFMYLAEHFRH